MKATDLSFKGSKTKTFSCQNEQRLQFSNEMTIVISLSVYKKLKNTGSFALILIGCGSCANVGAEQEIMARPPEKMSRKPTESQPFSFWLIC